MQNSIMNIVKGVVVILCCLCTVHQGHGETARYASCYPTDGSAPYVQVTGSNIEVTYVTLVQDFYDKTRMIRMPVIYICENAFRDRIKLRCINILSPLVRIDKLAFCNCIALDSVYLPVSGSYWYNKSLALETIGENVFQDCWKLKYINLPVSLKTIKRCAFLDCWSLPAIDIPYTVTTIGDYAFKNCKSLTSIVISTKLGYMGEDGLGEGIFQNCTAMETIEFYNKYNLKIKPLAFDNCKSLKTVKFNYNTIVLIDSCAFRGCTSLRKFTVPASLTQGVGPLAFEGCTALDTVTSLADVPPVMGRDAFRDVSPACVLMVPMGRTQAYRAAGWTEEVFKGGIVEMPAPAGISTIKVKPSDTKYYDLQGRPVTRPEKGRIYIHDGRKVVK